MSRSYTLQWLDSLADAHEQEVDCSHECVAKFATEVRDVLSQLARVGDFTLVREILLDERRRKGRNLSMAAEIAAICALAGGVAGVEMLFDVAQNGSFSSESNEALKALWLAGTKQPLPEAGAYLDLLLKAPIPVNGHIRHKASEAFDELVLASKENPTLFSKLLTVASADSIKNQVHGMQNEFSERLFRIFSAGSISISTSLVDAFELLVSQDLLEEEYQKYLKAHPIILDPLAAQILPKKRLGTEFITDFVIRRHDNRYLVVEIERPQDKIFNGSNDFSARFIHAFGQILDFQGWMSENVAYARGNLPLIENPRGLLVMGRRSDLTDFQESKLRRFVANSRSIEVVTFDDLVDSSRQLLSSLRRFDERSKPGSP